jgi:hypoxanthine phosphoribosyltransferase
MKVFYNWEDIDGRVNDLCQRLKHESFEAVYGVPRGGLIVAVLVSHKLGIPLITSLRDMYGKKFLVVDDIADTGRTLEKLKRLEVCSGATFATLDYHKQSSVVPDYWISEKGDKWIVYPWEREDSKEVQDYLV